MKMNFATIKKNPVAVGGIIVVGGLLLFMLLRGGGGATTASASGPSDAQIQAALQAQQMQFAAASQASNQQFQLAQTAQNIGGQIDLAKIGLQGQQAQIDASLAAMGSQIQLTKYQTDVSYQIQKDANATALAGQQAVLKSTYDLAKMSSDATIHLADLQTASHMADTQAFADIQKLYISGQTQTQLANITAGVQIAGIQGDVQKYIAKKQAQASIWGSAFSLGGTALAMFSDARLKTDVEHVGTLSNGMPVYRFKFLGLQTRYGVMAQEIASRMPEAIGGKLGYMTVDYSRVMAA